MSRKTQIDQRSFVGGVISPELWGRSDLPQYQSGLKTCINWIVKPSGAVTKRPGLEHINTIPVVGASKLTRVVHFEKNSDVSFALMFFDQGIWYFKNGEIVVSSTNLTLDPLLTSGDDLVFAAPHGLSVGDWIAPKTPGATSTPSRKLLLVTAVSSTFSGIDTATVQHVWDAVGATWDVDACYGKVYKTETSINEEDLLAMRITQSGLTMTLQVPGEYPRELTYVSDASWTYGAASFTADVSPPADGYSFCAIALESGAVVSTDINHTLRYVVTEVSDEGQESIATAVLGSQIGSSVVINSMTNANPAVFDTLATHGLIAGDAVILNLTGTGAGTALSGLNGQEYYVATTPTTTTFTLRNRRTNAALNTTSYQALSFGSWNMVGTRCNLSISGYRTYVAIYSSSALTGYRYNVYKDANRSGVFGFVGTVDPENVSCYRNGALTFLDDNITPDITRQPPTEWDPFIGGSNFCPSAVGHHNQRRVFGGSENDPQRMWLTAVGFPSSMNQHFPVLDDDAFDFRIFAKRRQKIQHIMSLGDMLVLTSSAVYQVVANGVDVSARAYSFVGANDVTPAECEGSVVFISNSGNRPHEVVYAQDGSGGYIAVDISVFAEHLFDGYTISSLAYCRGAIPTLWAIRSDGKLLSATYRPQQDVRAWHEHTIDGTPVSVCSVRENNEDRLYVSTLREVDGVEYAMLERLAPYRVVSRAEALLLDSSISDDSAPATSLTGLWHLEGEEVVGLADGVVVRNLTVQNGLVTFPYSATVRSVGKAYRADLETLPTAFRVAGGGMGRVKNVVGANLRVNDTDGISVGSSFDTLYEYRPEVSETYSAPPALISGEIEVPLLGDTDSDGTVCVRSDDPLPATILSLAVELSVGD